MFFSKGTPNLALVIPAMDKIDETLSNWLLDATLSPPVRAAVAIAKKTLNRYYSLTDQSEVYRIAMSACFIQSVYSLLFSHAHLLFTSPASKIQATVFSRCEMGT